MRPAGDAKKALDLGNRYRVLPVYRYIDNLDREEDFAKARRLLLRI